MDTPLTRPQAKTATSVAAAVKTSAAAVVTTSAAAAATSKVAAVTTAAAAQTTVASVVASTKAQTTPAAAAATTSAVIKVGTAVGNTATDDIVTTTTAAAVTSTTKAAGTTVTSHSSSNTVKVVTQSASTTRASSTSSHSASSTASAAAASASSSGVSSGTIAGIVIGVLLGVAFIGTVGMFLYKKMKARDYDNGAAPWTKMDNDDVTPFPANEKGPAATQTQDNYYGGAAAPMGGSNRALAIARQNAFYEDGTPRPDSIVDNNFAGYGAGHVYNSYPDQPSPSSQHYPAPAQHYPAQPQQAYPYQQGAVSTPVQQAYPSQYPQQYGGYDRSAVTPMSMTAPVQNPFDDGGYHEQQLQSGSPTSTSSGPRQLVGPGQQYGASSVMPVPVPVPAPVPLGRPEAPNTYDDIAAAEMYADDRYADDHLAAPAPVGLMRPYAEQDPYTPHTAVDDAEWAGAAQTGIRDSAVSHSSPLPEPVPLPTLTPMSPLMNPVSFNDDSTDLNHFNQQVAVPSSQGHQLALNDEDEDEETSRMYTEVARAAGVPDPNGAHVDAMRTQPYRHGQPLTPLPEVATPQSGNIALEPEVQRAVVPRPLPATPNTAPLATRSANPPSPVTSMPTSAAASSTRLPPPAADAVDEEDAYGGI